MDLIDISELKPHPRNEEFFDPITGIKWNEFLKSVKERGVIEPVIVTPEKVIVSGHHRVRACKELGIKEIKCVVRIYDNEDDVVRDLIETNIRQRGDVGGSEMKMAARIKELERIYGIQHGAKLFQGNQHQEVIANNYPSPKTQSDLATEFGISIATWKNYKRLADAIPELATAVDSGQVTKTTAIAMMRKLSETEQKELLSELGDSKKITNSDVNKYIELLNESQKEVDIAKRKVSELEEQLANTPVKTVKVIPDDYDDLKEAAEASQERVRQLKVELVQAKEKAEESGKSYMKLYKDFSKLETEMKRREGTPEQVKIAERDFQYFVSATNSFLRNYGGHIWAFNEFHNMPDYEKQDVIKAVKALDAFAQQLIRNLEGNIT